MQHTHTHIYTQTYKHEHERTHTQQEKKRERETYQKREHTQIHHRWDHTHNKNPKLNKSYVLFKMRPKLFTFSWLFCMYTLGDVVLAKLCSVALQHPDKNCHSCPMGDSESWQTFWEQIWMDQTITFVGQTCSSSVLYLYYAILALSSYSRKYNVWCTFRDINSCSGKYVHCRIRARI